MRRVLSFLVRELREALPATLLFLFLFHMIALTKAVSIGDYSTTALRATTATIGALIVAKAILVVEALPLGRIFATRAVYNILWKVALFGSVALLFRFLEEFIPLVSREGGVVEAVQALVREIHWPLFWVLSLWVLGGLLLYCIAAELVRASGPGHLKRLLLRAEEKR